MTTLADWLAAEPFALAMSSGFFGFYAHTGMLAALVERGLAPRALAGSSAGALVGGAHAAGLAPVDLARELVALERDAFWDPALGLGLLAGRKFDALLRRLLPVQTFAACRAPVAISVFDIAARATRIVTDGDLATAIRASCAVPAMFHPVRVAGRACWDGGVLDRPGLAGVPRGDRVLYHHLAGTRLPAPRPAMVTLAIAGLPRSGPFRLAAGRRALELAHDATRRALDREVVGPGPLAIDSRS